MKLKEAALARSSSRVSEPKQDDPPLPSPPKSRNKLHSEPLSDLERKKARVEKLKRKAATLLTDAVAEEEEAHWDRELKEAKALVRINARRLADAKALREGRPDEGFCVEVEVPSRMKGKGRVAGSNSSSVDRNLPPRHPSAPSHSTHVASISQRFITLDSDESDYSDELIVTYSTPEQPIASTSCVLGGG